MEATRLATRLLQDHAKEGRFEVIFDMYQDIDLVALRLKEQGCKVRIHRLKNMLEVEPPATKE